MGRNFAFTAVSLAIRLVAGTGLFLILARAWGPHDFGMFSFAASVSTALILVVDFGFPLFMLREVGAQPARAEELIEQGLAAKFFLTAVMSVIAVLVAITAGPDVLPFQLFLLLTVAAVLLSFAEFLISPLRALARYDLEAAVAAAGGALQLIMVGGTAWFGGTPTEAAAAMIVARGLYLLTTWRVLTRVVPKIRVPRKPVAIRRTLRQLMPYGVDTALTSAWSFLDIVVVRTLFGTEAVGLYAAGQKTMLTLISFAPLVGNVMIPQLARKAHTAAPDTWRTGVLTGGMMAAFGIAFAAPMLLAPGWITETLFGPSFARLEDLLPWFGAVLLVRYLAAAFGLVLSAVGLQRSRVVGQTIALVAYCVCIAVVAVRHLSLEAALGSLLVAMITMVFTYAIYVRIAVKNGLLGRRS